MTKEKQRVYVQVERHSVVKNRRVCMKDVGSFLCTDASLHKKICAQLLHRFPDKGTKSQMEFFSVLKLIEMMQEIDKDIEVINLGDSEFIVEYKPQKASKLWDAIKLSVLCVIVFFGSAFTIMAFNNDISITDVFDRLYIQVMGRAKTSISVIEIGYSIGIGLGILIFFNHVGQKKFSNDPTPIQVEVSKFKKDMDSTMLEMASRKGHKENVD